MLKTLYHLKFLFVLFFFFLSLGLFAQDIHYSQVGHSPQNLNPGLVGVFRGDHRIIGNFRQQWQSIPVPYLQLSGAYDWRIANKYKEQTPFAVGALFNYDRAGDANLSLTSFGLSGSYSYRLLSQKQHFLTFGVTGSLVQRAFDPTKLEFADQFRIKEGFATTNQSSEVFSDTNVLFGDIGGGVNLHLQSDSSRSKVDVGVGVFHFTEPQKNFDNSTEDYLNSRLSLYGIGALQIASRFDLLLHAMGQFQADYREVVLGVGGLIYLNQRRTKELALQFGVGYRIDDALIPALGIHYQNWQVHLSYDVNTSPLKAATNQRGGPEISLIYIIKNVPVLKYCPLCPTYM